jgi:hypothetical protein
MHLANIHYLRTSKDLKHPAARLPCSIRPNLNRSLISLEKNGVSDA